jgi:hypothetical protein
MKTLSRTGTSPNYLFGRLPLYFKVNDSYKDQYNRGLLERYLEIFCWEIDNNVSPFIDNAFYLLDAENLNSLPNTDPSIFLDHLSDTFGNPPDIGTETQYKALIRHIINILQTKGTRKSVDLYLALYGYKVYDITENTVTSKSYDDGLLFDNGVEYDFGFNFYSGWNLTITDLAGTGNKVPSEAWLESLKQAIQKFIAPIFATLEVISYVPYMGSMGKATVIGKIHS